jgi:hypothetical protein
MKYKNGNIENAVHEYINGTSSSFEVAKKYNMGRSRTYIWTWMRRHGIEKTNAKGKLNGKLIQHGGTVQRKASPLPEHTPSSEIMEPSAKSDEGIAPAKPNENHIRRPPLGYMEELKAKFKTNESEDGFLDSECIDMMKFIEKTHNEKIVEKQNANI